MGVPGFHGHEKGRCELLTFVAVTFSNNCFLIPWQFRFDIGREVRLVYTLGYTTSRAVFKNHKTNF